MPLMSRRTFLMGGALSLPYLYLETSSVAVRRYRVPIASLPAAFDGFTILHLSDLHEKEFGEESADLINILRRERFDLVALTGDFVRGDNPMLAPALNLIAGIQKISGSPIFCVLGNHDWRIRRGADFDELLRGAGVTMLLNQSAPLQRGKDRLWLAGVDDPVTFRDRLDLALKETDHQTPRLLLSHSPHPFRAAARQGVDLMLAGHTHGGQVRLPLLGASFVPAMGFFPRYDYGLFRIGASTLIVSGGLGESGIPVRVNIRPEVSVVTLVRSPGVPSVSAGAKG